MTTELCSRAWELPLLSPRATNNGVLCTKSLCSATREAITGRSLRTAQKGIPHSPQLEKAHAKQLRHSTAKTKF